LWGEDDRFVPVSVGRRLARAMPQARLVTLPDCRHFPPLEQPEATTAAARSWLADVLGGMRVSRRVRVPRTRVVRGTVG